MSIDFLKLNKVLIAGYGIPAEYTLIKLFSYGIEPENIALLTHDADQRNIGLISSAKLRNIKVCQFPAKSDEAFNFVRQFEPSLLLSIHYRKLIPARIIPTKKYGGINLHPSLLPDYKGANSIPWALINNEKKIGFTYHYMNEKFDEGNILYQESFDVLDNDTAFSLFHKSIILAMEKLDFVLAKVSSGDLGIIQKKEGRYYSRSLPFDGKIDCSWDKDRISRFIRAMYFPPLPNAVLEKNKQRLYIKSMKQYYQVLQEN